MGLNFPSSPLVGEVYPNPATSGVPQYMWDGEVWGSSLGGVNPALFVQKSGDVMSGDLVIEKNAPQLVLDRLDTTTNASLVGKTAGVVRWSISMEDILEVLFHDGSVASPILTGQYADGRAKASVPQLDVARRASAADIAIKGPSPRLDIYRNGETADQLRWVLRSGGAENGTNTGSNLSLERRTDDGGLLGYAFEVDRATGRLDTRAISTKGDLTVTRDNDTGFVHFGNVADAYLGYSGTSYALYGGPLYLNEGLTVDGDLRIQTDGDVTLLRDPSQPLHAVTKQYVDAIELLPGPAGPAGADGLDGAPGATGPQGPKGDTGDIGPAGADGVAGAQGPAGADGAPGATGATGPAGADSVVPGPMGPQGPQGEVGPQGPAGVADTSMLVLKSGDTMTGALRVPNIILGATSLTETFNEWGSTTVATPVYFDFHSSGPSGADYDVRISYSGGNAGSAQGTMQVEALHSVFTGYMRVGGGVHAWPFCVKAGPDINVGFIDGGGGTVTFGNINDAGSVWTPINIPSAVTHTNAVVHNSTVVTYGYTTNSGQTCNGAMTVNGDLTLHRGDTTGYFFPGNSGARYYGFDGGSMIINGAGANTRIVGSLSADAGITAGGSISTAANFHLNSGNGIYFEQGNTVRLYWDGANLVSSYNGFYSVGALGCSGNINGGSTVYSTWGFWTHSASGAGQPYIASIAGGNPAWGNIYLQGLHYAGNWAGFNVDNGGQGTFSLRGGGTCYKTGGFMYWDGYSDARIKDVLGEYKQGLEAVCALEPVSYVYKGNDTFAPASHFSDTVTAKADYPANRAEIEARPLIAPFENSPNAFVARERTVYVGLVAQHAEKSMPELFRREKGFIDGIEVDDLRSVNYTALTFAMINAFKELKARVEALEAA